MLVHPFAPVYDVRSRILILGSFPSPKSREFGFYYGNPQNLFWSVLARVLDTPEPARDRAAREAFLLQNRIAVWDVLHACEIDGASDHSIKNPVPNAFRPLLRASEISAIFTTGRTATDLFNELCAEEAGQRAGYLPSTSPANRARQREPDFLRRWADILKFLQIIRESTVFY
jgi:hypoxanthine-DNA glycosylase